MVFQIDRLPPNAVEPSGLRAPIYCY